MTAHAAIVAPATTSKRAAVFTALLLLPLISLAEQNSAAPRNVQFSNLTAEFEFSSEFVLDIEQDKLGFMWFATQSGLNRFDGHQVRVYEHISEDPASINHSFVWDLYLDDEGNLWIGTERGLNRYSYEQDEFVREPFPSVSLGDFRVRQITQDQQGNFWLGTLGDGLLRFDPKKNSLTQFMFDDNDDSTIPDNHVMSLLLDQRGELWIGTDGGGLARFDSGTDSFVRYSSIAGNQDALSGDRIRSIHEDSRGRLWVGTAAGGLNLFEADVGRFTHFKHDPLSPLSIPAGQISAVYEDTQGVLWVGTESGLAEYRPDAGAFVAYRYDVRAPSSLVNNRVNAIMQDGSGVLWVGTNGGISSWNYASDTFSYFRAKDGFLASDAVSAVGVCSEGIYWVGTYGGGLSRIDPRTGDIQHFRHDESDPTSLPDDRVMTIMIDRSDDVWVGTRSAGLARKRSDREDFERFSHDNSKPHSLSNNAVTSVLQDRSGGLWVGTFGGGLNYSKSSEQPIFTHYTHDAQIDTSLSGDRVLAVFEDIAGTIWVGTEGDGLNQLDLAAGNFLRYDLDQDDNESNWPRGTPWEIFETPDETLWVGTLGQGLLSLSPEDRQTGNTDAFNRFSSLQGLAPDIYAVLPGNSGKLWLSSNRGLFEFDTETQEARRFDRNNGLLGNEFNQGARFKSRTGQLLFGSNLGLVGFFPGDIATNNRVPIVSIEAQSRSEKLARTWSGGEVPTVNLEYFDAFVAFEFVALDFVSADKNEYRYRLVGLDNEWTTARNYRQAVYSTLPPGNYTFQVEASNNDGVWNRHQTAIDVYVVPPPWSTWWAYLIYAVLGASLIGFYVNSQRVKHIAEQRARERLEHLVGERTAELAERNNDLMSLNEQLEHASVTDALTGLRNRRFVDEHMVSELSKLRRKVFQSNSDDTAPEMVFLMMVDLDGFKAINDEFGHQAGDLALLGVKDRLLSACRQSDVVVRWGGDEFLIIGHANSLTGIEQFSEKVRLSLNSTPYDVGDGNIGKLSGSIGVAPIPFTGDDVDFATWEQICRIADTAAYIAKDSGRDAWVAVSGNDNFSTQDLTDLRENLPDMLERQKVRLKSSRSLNQVLA